MSQFTECEPVHEFQMKWWGWGSKTRLADLSHYPGIFPYMKKHFGINAKSQPEFQLKPLKLPPSAISESSLVTLSKAKILFSVTDECRLTHALGKSYRDLMLLRTQSLEKDKFPDIVLFPKSEQDIMTIYAWCLEHKLAVIPFGGGTSVVGGIDSLRGPGQVGAVSVDLCSMNNILSTDMASMTVKAQGGIFGPQLEKLLGQQNLTLGHFPQSFEFSTLGGWVATRSCGQNSCGYGGIEDMVQSLRIVTPKGAFETLPVPREAAGPSLKEILLGSEGLYGIITEVTIRVKKCPSSQHLCMYAFSDFAKAANAGKMLVQHEIPITILRISDEDETEAFVAMAKKAIPTFKEKIGEIYLRWMKIDSQKFCTMLVGFEGGDSEVKAHYKTAHALLRRSGGVPLGQGPGKKWAKDRFFLPYLRDPFLDLGLLVDTLETSTQWSNLHHLHQEIKTALKQIAEKQKASCKVFCHLSHYYANGVALYFSILANRQDGRELAQWMEFKQMANQVIFKNNASISHHHGIGVDHKTHLFHSPLHRAVVAAIKTQLDPEGIMNPGKIL
ncbi:MAG: FAD-binding oxidoreductase [Bdellovibrio sp.]|nr:FAD-binding oxidoreductase [Bdellovibrio sp.]